MKATIGGGGGPTVRITGPLLLELEEFMLEHAAHINKPTVGKSQAVTLAISTAQKLPKGATHEEKRAALREGMSKCRANWRGEVLWP